MKTNNGMKFVAAVINLAVQEQQRWHSQFILADARCVLFFVVIAHGGSPVWVQSLLIVSCVCVLQVYNFSFEAHVRYKLSESWTREHAAKTKESPNASAHFRIVLLCDAMRWDATSIKQDDHHFKCITSSITMDASKQTATASHYDTGKLRKNVHAIKLLDNEQIHI